MDRDLRSVLWRAVEGEPFARKLGLKVTCIEEGYARVEMEATEDLLNIHGIIHGGALFSLLDEAFQLASNSHGQKAVALTMNVAYHAPARAGGLLIAEAREFQCTARTSHCDIRVTDDRGVLIATCRALAYRRSDPLTLSEVPKASSDREGA
jgi:acyl-CoA thioesterase